MKQARGFKGKTTVDFESTFGTAPIPAKGTVVPFNSSDLGKKQALIETNTITGTRNPSQPGKGRITVDGGAEVPLDFSAFGIWLKAAFGQPVTIANGDGTYTHAFKIGDDQPSFVFAREFPDVGKTFIYRGCKLGSIKLPFGGDSELVATLSIAGKDRILGNGEYDADSTEIKLTRIDNYMATILENGVKAASMVSGELTIDLGLDLDQFTIGDGNTRGDIPEGMVNISGSGKFLFNTMSMINVADESLVRSLDVVFAHAKNKLEFHFPEIQWDATDPTVTGPAGIQYDMNWRAFLRDDPSQSVITVTLTNEVEEY